MNDSFGQCDGCGQRKNRTKHPVGTLLCSDCMKRATRRSEVNHPTVWLVAAPGAAGRIYAASLEREAALEYRKKLIDIGFTRVHVAKVRFNLLFKLAPTPIFNLGF